MAENNTVSSYNQEINDREGKIVSVQLHVAERVTGQMRGFVEAFSAQCEITFDQKDIGIWIKGKNTNSLVPWSNVRCVYISQEGQPRPLVRTK